MSFKLIHVVTVPDSLRTFFRGQLGHMKSNGFGVHAIASPGPSLDEFAQTEGIETKEVTMPRKISPWRDCLAIISLSWTFWRLRPKIVHAHTPKAGLLGMVAAWITRVPVRIYHIRGLPMVTTRGPRRLLLFLAESIACRLAHRVLCVSYSVRAVAIEEGLCSSEKIGVLCSGSGNGVDSSFRFNPTELGDEYRFQIRKSLGISQEALIVGFVGRIAGDKGVTELVEAWEGLRTDFPSLELLVIGDHDPRDPVPSQIVERLRDDSRVHLVGKTKETHKYYATMDICVLPTYREGLPNVLLEAAAMERPIVATRVPGCVDAVVEGQTALLVPAQDPVALHRAIRKYLVSSELRSRHGKSGRQWVQREFRPEKIWSALHSEYHHLASQQGLSLPKLEETLAQHLDAA